MQKKYKLIDAGAWRNIPCYRIEALRSFGNVEKGDLGGFVENENILSHEGNCWIERNSYVFGNNKISGDIVVKDYLRIIHTVPEKTFSTKPILKHNWYVNYAGFDEKTNQHFIRVGCQIHSIQDWKNETFRNKIASDNGLSKNLIPGFLKILEEIEKEYCNTDPFKKIEENIAEMKKSVTETLKTETISLISSLPVSKSVGPKRDPKTGRFAKKTP